MTRLFLLSLLLILLLVWAFTLRPTGVGGPAGYVMVSGQSMEPTLYTDDLVITREQSSYDVGDIVAFRVNSSIVIHRIVGGNGIDGFEMQGDNNSWHDEWHPKTEDIIGKRWLLIAGGVKYLDIVRTPGAFVGYALFVTVLGWFGTRPAVRSRPRGAAVITRAS